MVVQEIFGVNGHIRSVADGYAADGYRAIAPALFDRIERGVEIGYSQEEIQAGMALKQKVSWDQALADVGAAVAAVQPAGKVGVVGYCWGGSITWLAAARVPEIAAAVAYYGSAIPALIDEQPRCPALLHFGETDSSIPLAQAQAVAAAHPEADAHFYAAGHGFNCDQRSSYDAAAAQVARQRTLAFLRAHIG